MFLGVVVVIPGQILRRTNVVTVKLTKLEKSLLCVNLDHGASLYLFSTENVSSRSDALYYVSSFAKHNVKQHVSDAQISSTSARSQKMPNFFIFFFLLFQFIFT